MPVFACSIVALIILLLPLVACAQPAPAGEPAVESFSLPNVPYIGNNWQEKLDGPQDFMFPSAMGAVMKYLDPQTDRTYRFYLDVSGMAYQQLWHPQKWDSGFDSVWALYDDPAEAIRRCFEAAGYDFRLVGNTPVCGGKPLLRQRLPEYAEGDRLRQEVCASLAGGKPVIALGLQSGAAVIAGFEQRGKVLLGWTMEDEKAPLERGTNGYLRFPNWQERTEAVVLIGQKRGPLPLREVCRRTLVAAVRDSRRAQQGEYACGQAAFTAWAEALARADLQVQDLKRLEAPHQAHFFISLTVAEGRAFAYDLLERAGKLEPEAAADLDAAQEAHHLMHNLVWRLWQTEGSGSDNEKMARFSRPETRQELVRIVLLQRDLAALSTHHLAAAALRFGASAEDLLPAPPGEQEAVARMLQRVTTCGANRARLENHVVDMWLGQTPPLSFMKGQECTFAGALQAALASTARPCSYAEIMGYSGLAFRARWFDNPGHEPTAWGNGRWHPISPHGEGPEELAALTAATGWEFRREDFDRDPNAVSRQHLITDVVLSITEGLPVIIGRNTDLACIYGYNIHSMNLFVQDYQQPQEAQLRVPDSDAGFHGPIIFLSSLRAQPDPAAALRSSLARAVQHGRRPAADHFRYGADALQAWQEAVGQYEGCTRQERDLLFLVNSWTLLHLADARQAAADFLAGQADLLGGAQKQALLRAYELYRQEAQALHAFCQANTRFLMWWGGQAKPADWDAPTREAERALLARVQQLDEQALGELEKAAAQP